MRVYLSKKEAQALKDALELYHNRINTCDCGEIKRCLLLLERIRICEELQYNEKRGAINDNR